MSDEARLAIESKTEAGGQVLVLTGHVDENSDLVHRTADMVSGDHVAFDAERIETIDSLGVREWLRMTEALTSRGVAVVVRRCSEVMVQQINIMLGSMIAIDVESFMAPYACESCGVETMECLVVADHLGELVADKVPERVCAQCGKAMEFGDLAQRYFSFVRDAHSRKR